MIFFFDIKNFASEAYQWLVEVYSEPAERICYEWFHKVNVDDTECNVKFTKAWKWTYD